MRSFKNQKAGYTRKWSSQVRCIGYTATELEIPYCSLPLHITIKMENSPAIHFEIYLTR